MSKNTSSLGKVLAKKKRSGKVEFISQIEEIKHAMAEGWSKKNIWEELSTENKISFSYQMFLRYVNELILGKKRTRIIKPKNSDTDASTAEENKQQKKKNEVKQQPNFKMEKEPIKASIGKKAAFVFKADPTRAARINKDELY